MEIKETLENKCKMQKAKGNRTEKEICFSTLESSLEEKKAGSGHLKEKYRLESQISGIGDRRNKDARLQRGL